MVMIFGGLFPVAWWCVSFSLSYGMCLSGLCVNVFQLWRLQQLRPDLTASLLKPFTLCFLCRKKIYFFRLLL